MTHHATASDPTVKPPVPVCLACSSADHEQVLVEEVCACPCHGEHNPVSEGRHDYRQ